mmetsp:Transcript_84343/g.168872  ORF Transcript_84343/g.168872 Transcript_84343/m.168872 type:complete len:340 (+) Transcript_84343:85-1104(+)
MAPQLLISFVVILFCASMKCTSSSHVVTVPKKSKKAKKTKFLYPEYLNGANNQFFGFGYMASEALKKKETLVLQKFFDTLHSGKNVRARTYLYDPDYYFNISRLEHTLNLKTIGMANFKHKCPMNSSCTVRKTTKFPNSYKGMYSPNKVPIGMAALRFSSNITNLALSVLSSIWGDGVNSISHPYLAVHVRRKLPWHKETCNKVLCLEKEAVAERIIRYARATGLSRVYISTNANSTEQLFYHRILAAGGLSSASSVSSTAKIVFQNFSGFTTSVVEQQISYLAKEFLGTFTSTWTGTVAMMRSSDRPPSRNTYFPLTPISNMTVSKDLHLGELAFRLT